MPHERTGAYFRYVVVQKVFPSPGDSSLKIAEVDVITTEMRTYLLQTHLLRMVLQKNMRLIKSVTTHQHTACS